MGDDIAERTTRPLLVLVSGAPASGKSTLAPRLARTLSLPLLARDHIREALADAIHDDDGVQRPAVLAATFRIFYRLLADMLSTGDGLVAESNFHRGVAEGDLRPFLPLARIVIVHCHTTLDVSFRRFVARSEHDERHWSSFDAERIAQIRDGHIPAAWERAQPLDLDVPIMQVDTTDGYVPDLDGVVAFIRSAVPLSERT